MRRCGFFAGTALPRYGYKYDDFEACFCADAESEQYCAHWVCHGFRNNAKHDLSLDADAADPAFDNYWTCNTSNAESEGVRTTECLEWTGSLECGSTALNSNPQSNKWTVQAPLQSV